MEDLLGAGEATHEAVADMLAEFADVTDERIALDLEYMWNREPKTGLPEVGLDLFPMPDTLGIYLRFRVEDSILSVGWRAAGEPEASGS